MGRSKGFEIRRPATVGILLCTLVAALVAVCGCGEQLTRMEENQVRLQAMLAANARELATLSSQVHAGNGKLAESLRDLDADAQGIAAGVQTVQDQNRQLRETVVAGNQGLDTKLAQLGQDQHSLDDRVAQVQDVTGRTASNLASLAQEHTALGQTVRANQKELNDSLGAVATNQRGIQAGITQLRQADEGLARDIATVAGKQDALSAAVQENHRQTAERFAALAGGQDRLSADLLNVHALVQTVATDMNAAMQANTKTLADKLSILEVNQAHHRTGLDRMAGTVNQTAATIAAIAAAQTAMQETLDANHENVTSQIAGVSERQQSLRAGIGALTAKVDQAAADSAAAVESLQESVRISREVLTGQVAVSLQNQQAIQSSVTDLAGRTDRLAANLSQVSAEQMTDRETTRSNHDAVLTAMAGLANDNQTLRAGIDRLDGQADRMGTELSSVAAEQKSLHETTRAHHEAALARLGNLSRSQAELHDGVSTLNDRADAVATELAAAAQRQDAAQQSLTAARETLDARTTAIAQTQQELKAGIADLSTTTRQVSTDVATVAAAQDAFRRMQESHSEAFAARTKELADSQQAVRNQLDGLTATAGQTALAVLTMNNGQATFQQAMQTGMNGIHERADQTAAGVGRMVEQQTALNDSLAAQAATLNENQQVMKADITRMAGVVDRAYADLTAVSLAQDTLQSTLTSRSDEISGRVALVENNQEALADNVNVLTATAGQTAADVIALAAGQTDLHKSVKTGNEAILGRTTALAQGQGTLGSHLDTLTATAGQTALDIMGLSNRQDAFQRVLQNHSESVSNRMATVADNQKQMQDGLNVLTATTGQTAVDVIALAAGQTDLHKSVKTGNEAILGQTTALAKGQGTLGSHLDTLTATTGQTALDIMSLSSRQDAFQKVVQSHNESANSRMAKLADNQQQMQDGLNVLAATTGQTALDVMNLASRQDAFQKTVQSHNESANSRMAKLADNQQQMQDGLNVLAATTGQTALDVMNLASRQDAFQKTVQSHNESADGRMAKLADNQQQMQDGLNVLAATTGQTSLDVMNLAGRQDAFQKAVQSHNESADGRMAKLADNQQQMQSGLDTVTATTGQTALDVMALNQSQSRLEQTTQTGHAETVAKLATLAQNQDNWLRRLDTAQAGIRAMADGIATLEQQFGTLQAALQAGIEDTATLVDAGGQQRQQFEARITQDVQAMIDAIAQLRQTQAQLQEQVGQVHKSTQSQAETLKAAIDQIKQPPAELKVSDAAKKAEPAIVQTGE